MYIPGHGAKVVRLYFAAGDGDKPALASMCGMDKGASTYGCHLDCYKTNRNSVVYDCNQHKYRDFKMQLDAQKLAELARLRKESAEVVSQAEIKLGTRALAFCNKYGLKAYVPALYGIPIAYDDPHDFFDGFYYDKDLNTRTIGVQTRVLDNNCPAKVSDPVEVTFKFYVINNGSYIFKFYKGEDANGTNIFETVEIPVTN